MKNIKKEDVFIYAIILAICFLLVNKLLNEHYTLDSYVAIHDGFKLYGTYAMTSIGRLNSALYFYLFELLNIKYNTVTIISAFLSIIIASVCIKILYNSFIDCFTKTTINKICILLLSLISLLNPLTMEYFAYFESPIMWIGILCSICASKIFISNIKHKYLYSQILLVVAAFSYQITLCVFPTLILFLAFLKNRNLKLNIKKILLCFLQFFIAASINMFFIYVITSKIFDIGFYKLASSYSIQGFIRNITYYFNVFFINSNYYAPKYIYFIIIGIIAILLIYTLIINKKSINNIFNYFIIIIFSCIFSLMPMLSIDESSLYTGSRLFIGAVIVLPFSVIFLLSFANHYKYSKYILSFIITIILGLNFYLCYEILGQLIQNNTIEKHDAMYVIDKIENYQSTTNKQVKYYELNPDRILKHFSNIPCLSLEKNYPFLISKNIFYNTIFFPKLIYTYGNIKLEMTVNSNSSYANYCNHNDWDNLNINNVIIDNETIYICLY